MLATMEQTLALLDRLHARDTRQASTSRQQSGEIGERAAYFHIRRQGYTVVARRWRHAFLDGEVDLIAWDAETLCIVEVKTRAASTPFAAEFQVDTSKQQALHRMAKAYLQQLPWPDRHPGPLALRFDVVSVYLPLKGKPDVRLLRDAFR